MSDPKRKPRSHIPHLVDEKPPSAMLAVIKDLFFDLVVLFANIVVHTFFREVSIRGSFNLPKKGPTIVVCAPHANQYVDGAIILSQIRGLVNRNSPPIIAESSYKKAFIGTWAKLAGAIPVPRAQDNLKFVDGEIFVKNDDFKRVFGKGTTFTKFTSKALIGLPESAGNAEIEEIISDTELTLRKPFKRSKKSDLFLKEGTKFKYAPKISNDDTFQHVFNALHKGGIITIFPEGGSHDRPELLPIKAGFAIMALGAVAADPSQPINIVPTGLSYFHRNMFRSRAVVEFGAPIKITAEDGENYKQNPRETVAKLLDEVTTALNSVTLTAPDYETLQVIQAARRLYASKVPLSMVIEMNRKLLTGYKHYKDHPRIIKLKNDVIDYNRKLAQLGIKDHQVEKAVGNPIESLGKLIYRSLKLVTLSCLSLPGIILFAPIFIVTDEISKRKQKEALAASVVKIKAVDVVATWKILVATVFAPSLYVTYSIVGTILIRRYDLFGVGFLNIIYQFVLMYLLLVSTTYASFRIGEAGVDIVKSLPPLVQAVFGPCDELAKLQKKKEELQLLITEIVNDLGPKVFPDFDEYSNKVVSEDEEEDYDNHRSGKESGPSSGRHARSASTASTTSASSIGLSRVNSEGDLSDIPILGDGGKYHYNDTLSFSDYKTDGSETQSTGAGFETEASLKLRKALKERLQKQRTENRKEEETYEEENASDD